MFHDGRTTLYFSNNPRRAIVGTQRELQKARTHESHDVFLQITSTRAKTVPLVFHETATQAPARRWKIPMPQFFRYTFLLDASVIQFCHFETPQYIAFRDYYRVSPPWSGVCAFGTDVHAWCWQWVPLMWALSRWKGDENKTNNKHTLVLYNFPNVSILFPRVHTLPKIGRIPLPVVSCPKLSGRSSLPSRWRGVGRQDRTLYTC